MSLLKICLRFTLVLVFGIILLGATVILTPKYRQLRHLHGERDRLDRDREQTEAMISGLRRKQERFASDPEFVERIARQNRRIRPGETVFVLDASAVATQDRLDR